MSHLPIPLGQHMVYMRFPVLNCSPVYTITSTINRSIIQSLNLSNFINIHTVYERSLISISFIYSFAGFKMHGLRVIVASWDQKKGCRTLHALVLLVNRMLC